MLDKKDVDRMVREATEHADEDRRRREEVEARNQAEALTFQAERTLKDLGDKVSAEDRAAVEGKVSDVRNALKTEAVEVRVAERLRDAGLSCVLGAGGVADGLRARRSDQAIHLALHLPGSGFLAENHRDDFDGDDQQRRQRLRVSSPEHEDLGSLILRQGGTYLVSEYVPT